VTCSRFTLTCLPLFAALLAPPPVNAAEPGGTAELHRAAAGTAFFVTHDGRALTSAALINPACRQIRVAGAAEAGALIASDLAHDLALVQLPAPGRLHASFAADATALHQGDELFVAGFPADGAAAAAALTRGVAGAIAVSGPDAGRFAFSASAGGSAGSPVLDAKGDVVGMVTAGAASGAAQSAATAASGGRVAIDGRSLQAFLVAQGVRVDPGLGWFSRSKPVADLQSMARSWTVAVECWR